MEPLFFDLFHDMSERFSVRRLREEDVPSVFALCRRNELYYRYYPPMATEDSIRADMAALPPGKTAEDKYYLGYFPEGKLIAVLDLILRYPDEETAFIGFFMVEADEQKRGLGSCLIGELCDTLKAMRFARLRLCWAAGNPQAGHFWKKNGFTEIKTICNTGGRTVILAERFL